MNWSIHNCSACRKCTAWIMLSVCNCSGTFAIVAENIAIFCCRSNTRLLDCTVLHFNFVISSIQKLGLIELYIWSKKKNNKNSETNTKSQLKAKKQRLFIYYYDYCYFNENYYSIYYYYFLLCVIFYFFLVYFIYNGYGGPLWCLSHIGSFNVLTRNNKKKTKKSKKREIEIIWNKKNYRLVVSSNINVNGSEQWVRRECRNGAMQYEQYFFFRV